MRRIVAFSLFAVAGIASAKNCTIDLKADDQMKFDQATVTVAASCPTITIKLAHTGKLAVTAMGHNVAISPTDSYQAVAQDGLKAGAAGHYLPAGDTRVLGSTPLIGGGETITATFPGNRLKAGGDYTFYCSFPGHWSLMKGKLVVE
ncbi:azurin [Tahibacter amnicola]|uniref:Azurin n=1 Tax=Tahibacter amnicola TaxID=2976241 RepID=A0ABY6BFD7_9GAMM|nr:azurin [Tahibacter amnicola]UXI66582.1 azurin [Tahibacter amnicola]